MNKSLAKKGTTLNKNMTNTENLILDNLEVTSHITLPGYIYPNTPSDPIESSFYIKKAGLVNSCFTQTELDIKYIFYCLLFGSLFFRVITIIKIH